MYIRGHSYWLSEHMVHMVSCTGSSSCCPLKLQHHVFYVPSTEYSSHFTAYFPVFTHDIHHQTTIKQHIYPIICPLYNITSP